MAITIAISAILAIVFGIIILVFPKVINYAIGIWLLIYGLVELINM